MKKFVLSLFILLISLFSFNIVVAQETELEGLWIGYEVDRGGTWTFKFTGNICEICDSDSLEQYNGHFTLDTNTTPKRCE